MKKMFLAIASLLLLPLASAVQVNPDHWSVTLRPGGDAQETFYVLNDQNSSLSLSISSNSSWIWLSKTSMTLEPYSSDSFNALLLVPGAATDGVYHFKISVDGNDINVTVTVQRWVWNKTLWVKEGSYVYFDGTNDGFKLMDVDFTNSRVHLGFVSSGSVTSDTWIDQGSSWESDDLKIDALDMFDDYAKLKIWSTTSHSVSVQEEQESQEAQIEGEFRFYVTEFGNTYVQGGGSSERFTLRNGLNEPVELKTISFEGTTIDSNGVRKPIRLEHYSLVTLEPGQEKSFDIIIDTEGLDPGEYRCAFYVSGLGKNSGQVYTAGVHFDIWVIQKIAPSEKGLKITAPKKVDVNEQFEIKVTGLKEDDTVVIYQLPEMVTNNVERDGDEYVWSGKITKAGNYTIQINVVKSNGIALPFFKQIQVGETKQEVNETEITIIPYPPKDGDTVSVLVEPKATPEIVVYEDGTIVARYYYSSPFKVESGKKYCIKAKPKGFEEKEVCFTIQKKQFSVSITPTSPLVGDTLNVQVKNQDGTPVTVPVTITINDKVFNSPAASYDITDDSPITIRVEASGYKTFTQTVTPRVPITNISVIPNVTFVGNEVSFKINRPSMWEVRHGAEVLTYSNAPTDTISFVPKEEGDYDVYVEGKKIATVHVKAGLFSILSGSYVPTFFGIGIIAFLVYLIVFKRKKKPKLGYSPYQETGPVEVEEG